MKHPRRYCVDCGKEQFMAIKSGRKYDMYHCRVCGGQISRVGDNSDPIKHYKSVEALHVQEDIEGSLLDAVCSNPDVLSDERSMWTSRSPQEEADREDMLRTFKCALSNLTARQAQVLEAVRKYGTHAKAAQRLGVASGTVNTIISQIRQKLEKVSIV